MSDGIGVHGFAGLSMEGILQRGRAPDAEVAVVMTIHETHEKSLS